MTTPNILRDTTPVIDPEEPTIARCTITDAWGLFYAQGGVVMAAALRAMAAVLGRDDLALSSASATFCRPVPCGPVEVHVQVLRSGRRGAQVHASLVVAGEDPEDANVVATAVFTAPDLDGPDLDPVGLPAELAAPPADGGRPPGRAPDRDEDPFPLGFLDNTEWRTALPEGARLDEQPPRMPLWFRFTDPPAADGEPWDPALLPIPGDSLGSALSVALSDGETPVGSVSLQIGLQVFGPVVGTWIGSDSVCTNVGAGLAHGVLHLWSETGVHVGTVTQTAMLRSF